MITLTYPSNYPMDGRVCKSHLNRLLTQIRSDYKGLKYVWCMELKERGAPHFHIFTTCPLPGRTYISASWYHIVNYGDKKHLATGTQVKPLNNSKKGEKVCNCKESHGETSERSSRGATEGRSWRPKGGAGDRRAEQATEGSAECRVHSLFHGETSERSERRATLL
uniref:Replication-associated protein ORF2/G2P domain-containing protein n=1 Tax=Zygnema circumcarinatum TaxID=35869 RepID=A0A6N0GXJ2_ZYGCR|nr:hypothetical protein P8547_mgp35 [Zygnema circumcarinatum]QKQ14705.1 hypothetical protein [Zygnema circumcarinatum]WEL36349.1 hypothetical protein [Zygnema circumcarinatum]